jgi:hypothetical protein
MNTRRHISIVLSAGVIGTMLLSIGCSRNDESVRAERNKVWQAHVPCGDDLIIVADMSALRAAESYQPADPTDAQTLALKEKAGFSQEDVAMLVASFDLDSMPSFEALKEMVSVEPSGTPDTSAIQGQTLSGVDATVLLLLETPITWEQAQAAVDVIFADKIGAAVHKHTDSQKITVTQTVSPIPLYVTLEDEGTILKLKTAKPRGEDGSTELDLEAIFAAHRSVVTNGPVKVIMHANMNLRKKVRELIEKTMSAPEKDTSSLMIASLLKPFVTFTGFSIALTPGAENTGVYGSIGLGTEENAIKADSVLQTALIPLITLALSQYSQDTGTPLLQDTETMVSGTKVILKTKLNAQPIKLPLPGQTGSANPAL